MIRLTLVFGLLLIALGFVGFVGDSRTDRYLDSPGVSSSSTVAGQTTTPPKRSITALIPAFTGGLLLLFGLIARNEKWRKHAMHVAAVVGFLGFLAAGGRAAMGFVALVTANEVINSRSLFFVSMMALLCAIFVAFCLTSFVKARRRQPEVRLQTAAGQAEDAVN